MNRAACTAAMVVPVVALVASLAGCSSSSAGSCAYVVVLEDRAYQYVAASGVQTGEVVGTGVSPGCNDGQPVPAATLPDPLVEVVGLDATQAVAVVHDNGTIDLLIRSDLAANPSSEVGAYLADHPVAEPAP